MTVSVYCAPWVTVPVTVPVAVAVVPAGTACVRVDIEATVFPLLSLSIIPVTVALLLPVFVTIADKAVTVHYFG